MEPSDMFNPPGTLGSFLTSYEENSPKDSAGTQPEMLVRDLRKLTLSPTAKLPYPPPEDRPRVQHQKERVVQESRDDFPKQRGVRTLLSVQKDPKAKMKRLIRIEKKLRSTALKGDQGARSEPFKCTCTFCTYQGWDPSENAKLGCD
ncbi:developmental pluripotency-associated protein 3 [Nannospalax galili]|uniref:developmental pluripotency-associated protein 3 n=1 Tax=Nannospalax galili TaxID=1026970 RepID=UPI0004ED681D|nr:developmental pluripotency-associated protein 3 [Nannospalax galili]